MPDLLGRGVAASAGAAVFWQLAGLGHDQRLERATMSSEAEFPDG